MITKKTEVKVFKVNRVCERCREGNMILDKSGVARLTYPPRYSHTCDNCGNNDFFIEKYPEIVYEDA